MTFIFFCCCFYHLSQFLILSCDLEIYPSVLSLKSLIPHHICGGVLLHPLWTLTAAHCLYNRRNPNELLVAGRGFFPYFYKYVYVEKIFMPEEYDPKTLQNDFGLLRLESSLNFVYTKIASNDLMSLIIEKQKDVEFIIWETNKAKGRVEKSIMFECIASRVLNRTESFLWYDGVVDPETMICVLSKGKALPCQGDSGSPVFYKKVVIGLVSFGLNCENLDLPNVISRADCGLKFVNDTIQKYGSNLVNSTLEGFSVYSISSKAEIKTYISQILLIIYATFSTLY